MIIDCKEELYSFAESVNSGNSYEGISVILNGDIYLNNNLIDSEGKVIIEDPIEWTPIGTEQSPFKGNFNGNGNSVYGIYINNDSSNSGLFGVISNATIKNVYVKDSYINNAGHSGAIVGYAHSNSVISSCVNIGSSICTYNGRSGGIVGWTSNSDVYNCINTGYIYSARCSGGIVGDVYSYGKIYNCSNTGNIAGSHELTGGIAGGTTGADIRNCLNIGKIERGYLISGGPGDRCITNCFAYKNAEFNSGIGGTAYLFDSYSAKLGEPLNIGGNDYTTVVDALNAFKYTMDMSVVPADWSQSDSYPTLNITVDKPSKTTILSYDKDAQTAIIYPASDEKNIVLFASYDENKRLNNIDFVESAFVSGVYADVLQNDRTFTLGTDDKIMIWNDDTTLSPVCEAFVIE